MYGRSGATLSLWTMGANQSVAGVDKNLALINLALATGNIGRPGAGPFSLTGQPNAMGGREAGGLAHTLPGHRLVANPEHRREMEAFWGIDAGSISDKPGLTAVDMFEAVGAGAVKAVWVVATNPAASMPNASCVRDGLRRAELVVVQDAYHPTETSELAHVLLPAAQWSEREGTMTNAERRVAYLEQAAPPPGQALPDWEIISRFAAKMGLGCHFAYENAEAIFEEFKQTTRGRDLDMTGITYMRLREANGLQWPLPKGAAAGRTRLYEDGIFPTESGRARFFVTPFVAPAELTSADYPFVLTTGRIKDQWHTRTRTGRVKKLVSANPEPFVEINSQDARHLGIRNGQQVELQSARGSARFKAKVTSDIRAGTVFTPFHWGSLWTAHGTANDMTVDAYDPRSKEPELKHCAVDLIPVAQQCIRA
jgi:predicted molibdopterin-dependent oxidoreductase YjgC